MIERIEQFRPELQSMSVRDVEELRNNQIPFVVSAAANHAFSCVTELTWSWIRQLADVEPSINGAVTAWQVRVAQKIGVGPDERDPKRRGRQSRTVLESTNSTDLPVPGDFPQQIISLLEKRKLIKPARD